MKKAYKSDIEKIFKDAENSEELCKGIKDHSHVHDRMLELMDIDTNKENKED